MITDVLTKLRESHGYTMKEVAEGIGIKPDTYRSYERGRLQPSLEIITKLACFYQVSADYLLEINPSKTKENPLKNLRLSQEEEKELVEKIDTLPPYGKVIVDYVIKALIEAHAIPESAEYLEKTDEST